MVAQETGPNRAEIDAALRGQVPMTAAISRQIDVLDAALDAKPTPGPLLLWPPTGSLVFDPETITKNDVMVEHAYLLVSFTEAGAGTAATDPKVQLQVPAGIPAIYLAGPNMLLLAHGLTWHVASLVVAHGRLELTGRVRG